jgi:hypothetical protein
VALDQFLPTLAVPAPDLVKIDAEGWDLEVIKGAKNTLKNAQVVLMEAAVMCKAFTNSVAKTTEAMADMGFCVFDITDLNRTQKHNALWLIELAFVKTGGPLDRQVGSYS